MINRVLLMLILAGSAACGHARVSITPSAPRVTPALATAAVGDDPISELAWLAGCWQVRGATTTIEEMWLAPRGGLLLGVSRTVRNGRAIDFEHTRIELSEGRPAFTAKPARQPEATFVATESSSTAVVFENPDHDFPQRISYRKVGSDSLHARIEGTTNGRARGVDFKYGRVQCSL